MEGACVAVAYSGGRDSSALLHATLAAAAPLGLTVVALHVHHGLSLQADAWLAHCQKQCATWARSGRALVFVSHRETQRPAAGESVEAWARTIRYRALRSMATEQRATLVLLAQHRRDQAETFLLQSLRGAGPAGLAGMPASALRDGITWARPWLDEPREQIEAYAVRHRLQYVDDDSNGDPRFLRNRLRSKLWPALTQAFPEAEAALADSARWSQEALQCLSELAEQDMPALLAGSDGLRVGPWLELTPARRSNVLRAWLKRRMGQPAATNLVARLMAELRPASPARWQGGAGELRIYRGVLRHVVPERAALAASTPEEVVAVIGPADYPLPGWGGILRVTSATDGGVPLAWLGRLDIKCRQGAEKFQAGIGRPPRSLKKQYQASGVASWDREVPLFYSGGQLVFVPGLGIDARVLAEPGQPQVHLLWLPLSPQPRD